MKHSILAFILLTTFAFSAFSQEDSAIDGEKRKQFFKELRDYKHTYLSKELGLTKEQQQKFFPIYDEMEDQVANLNEETREMERKVSENIDNASDLELEKATEALYELKIKEGETEKSYSAKFDGILTKKQLFQLKNAERNFNRELLQHQSRLRRRMKN